jgi:hypothetical protein
MLEEELAYFLFVSNLFFLKSTGKLHVQYWKAFSIEFYHLILSFHSKRKSNQYQHVTEFFYSIAELEQGEALRYLYRWLQNHPKYGNLAPPHSTDSPYGPDVSGCSELLAWIFIIFYELIKPWLLQHPDGYSV